MNVMSNLKKSHVLVGVPGTLVEILYAMWKVQLLSAWVPWESTRGEIACFPEEKKPPVKERVAVSQTKQGMVIGESERISGVTMWKRVIGWWGKDLTDHGLATAEQNA